MDQAATDIRQCLDQGADSVQIDFTQGRLSLKLDPSGGVLDAFISLNNEVLGRFSLEARRRLGVHTCPGGDRTLHAAEYLPLSSFGTTDCRFSPFADDRSTSRDTAFEKIRARVIGTKLAAERLKVPE